MADRMKDSPDRLAALDALLDGAHWVGLNMHDTFEFATADVEFMEIDDVEPMLPLISRHGHHALVAYVAVKRSIQDGERVDPIHCRCCHDGEEYHAARAEIEAMLEQRDEEGLPPILAEVVELPEEGAGGGTHCTFIVRTPGDPEAEFVITGDPDLEQVQAVLRRSMAREGGAK